MKVIADPNSSPREVASAARAIIAAENQNISDEQHIDNRMDESRNRLLAIAERIEARGDSVRTIDGRTISVTPSNTEPKKLED